jgi:hypothetical protein
VRQQLLLHVSLSVVWHSVRRLKLVTNRIYMETNESGVIYRLAINADDQIVRAFNATTIHAELMLVTLAPSDVPRLPLSR